MTWANSAVVEPREANTWPRGLYPRPGQVVRVPDLTTVSGEGVRQITCSGKDFEDNTGAGPGSANAATIRIDTTTPVLTCEAAVFDQGQQAVVKAAVTDAGSGPAQATVSTTVDTSSHGGVDGDA